MLTKQLHRLNQYELLFGSDDYIGTHMNFVSCSQCSAGGDATISTLIGYQQVLPVPINQSVDTVLDLHLVNPTLYMILQIMWYIQILLVIFYNGT